MTLTSIHITVEMHIQNKSLIELNEEILISLKTQLESLKTQLKSLKLSNQM